MKLRLDQSDHPMTLLPLLCSGPLIGAGLFHPFRLAWLGAIVGFLALVALLLFAVVTADMTVDI